MYQIEVRQEKIRADYVERAISLWKRSVPISTSPALTSAITCSTAAKRTPSPTKRRSSKRAAASNRAFATTSLSRGQPSARSSIQFRKETRAYLDTVRFPAVAWTTEERRSRGAAFVQDQVLPRRSLVVDLTDRVRITERQLRGEQHGSGRSLFETSARAWFRCCAFTLGIGLALAGSSLRRVLALERKGDPLSGDPPTRSLRLKRLSS